MRYHKKWSHNALLPPDFPSHGQHWQRPVQPAEARHGPDTPLPNGSGSLPELATPQVLYPQEGVLSGYDCDCACDLGLPKALATPLADNAYDCDCACALSLTTARGVDASPALWQKAAHLTAYDLGSGWQACFNREGPVGVSVLNGKARQVLAAFEAPASVEQAAVRLPGLSRQAMEDTIGTLAQIGLLRPMADVASPVLPAALARPVKVSAWLHITDACNLRCPYCYVHKNPGHMSIAVGRRAVDRLVEAAQRHGYGGLKLKYAGGEPTLRFSTVEAIHDYALSRTADLGLELEEVILSNGVDVSGRMLDVMARERIELMVSLDGGPETHDWLRARPDGAGTYRAVTQTIERAQSRGLEPRISITLTALNLEGVPQAVAFALERGLPFNLNFYRECQGAGIGEAGDLMPDPGRLVETMRDIFDLIAAHPAYPRPLTGILDRTRLDIPHDRPCSAGQDYLVVDSQGRVSACQMLLGQPWTTLDEEDPLAALRQRGRELFVSVVELPGCRDCQWRTICAGGCPLMRETTLHDRYCGVYKAVLPELVRLEASRLIAAHSTPAVPHPQ